MAILTSNPKILAIALLGGIIPSFLWLWFWLKEEESPEPKKVLSKVFIMGIISVIIVLPIEKFIQSIISSNGIQIILWASAEEILKYLAVLIIIYKTGYIKKPIDWPIYMVTAALGFATLENALFLIKPLSESGVKLSLLDTASLGQLRFLGSTLLHSISSGMIGIMLGLSFFMEKIKKAWLIFSGFLIAIALHSAFNFFIMKDNDFMQTFAFLWVVTIIVMLLLEKIRRISENSETQIGVPAENVGINN